MNDDYRVQQGLADHGEPGRDWRQLVLKKNPLTWL